MKEGLLEKSCTSTIPVYKLIHYKNILRSLVKYLPNWINK